MTQNEKLALKHQMYIYKTSENEKMRRIMIEQGWISYKPEVLEVIENGKEKFELNIVKRILTETPDKVFFNNCPNCGKLARTPQAKQCRCCSYSWHSKI